MSWLNYMSRKFLRIRRGLALYPDLGPTENPERHCHAWAACNYIEAQMSSSDTLHSEATNCQNPELPPSPVGFTRELPPENQPLGAIPRDGQELKVGCLD
ncbi:hypothetical protein PENSPDRAFT_680703 [Peniophora sp. CONT]|nr:hypothetical protein PENSPDRAFT_680703 [Peniophora sp. CONT]